MQYKDCLTQIGSTLEAGFMIRAVLRNYLLWSAKQPTGQSPPEAKTNNKSSSQRLGKWIIPSPRWSCFHCTDSKYFVQLKGNFNGKKMGYKLMNYQRSYYFSLPWRESCPNCGHPPRRAGGWLLLLVPGKSSLSLGKAAWSCPSLGGTCRRLLQGQLLSGALAAVASAGLQKAPSLAEVRHWTRHICRNICNLPWWCSSVADAPKTHLISIPSVCTGDSGPGHPHRPHHTTLLSLVGVTGSSTQGKDLGQTFYITETLFVAYLYKLNFFFFWSPALIYFSKEHLSVFEGHFRARQGETNYTWKI